MVGWCSEEFSQEIYWIVYAFIVGYHYVFEEFAFVEQSLYNANFYPIKEVEF